MDFIKNLIPAICITVIFVIGVAAGADKERVKNQQLLLEQQVKYEEKAVIYFFKMCLMRCWSQVL